MYLHDQKHVMPRKGIVPQLFPVVHLLALWVTGAFFIALCTLYCHWSLNFTDSVGVAAATRLDSGVQLPLLPQQLLGPSEQHRPMQGCLRLCYYVLPRHNSSDELQPEAVDPLLCSHLAVVAPGSRILNDTIQLGRPEDAELLGRVVGLKERNPSLRVLLSLMLGFSQIVSNRTAMISFAYNARMFVEQHGLDGLDLDWEFPAWSPDPRTGEKGLFVIFLDKLSTSLRLVEPAYLITVAVTGIQPYLDRSYDIPGLSRNADFISLMGYDYHMYKGYLPFTGHNAPLSPHHTDVGYLASLNVEASVAALEKRGLPRNKLLVGLPMYGRTWRLASAQYQNLGALAVGEGFGGGYVSYTGAWAFARSADLVVMDEEAAVPYAARGTDWISYENLQSIAAKVNFIKKAGIAGAMTFHLGCDDWAGVTGQRFPLHSVVRSALCSGCCPAPASRAQPLPQSRSPPLGADLLLLRDDYAAHHDNATLADLSIGSESSFHFSLFEGSGVDTKNFDLKVGYNSGLGGVPMSAEGSKVNNVKMYETSEWRNLLNKSKERRRKRILHDSRGKLNSSNREKSPNYYTFMPSADKSAAIVAVGEPKDRSPPAGRSPGAHFLPGRQEPSAPVTARSAARFYSAPHLAELGLSRSQKVLHNISLIFNRMRSRESA